MKVKVLSRNPDDYLRETKQDIHKGIHSCPTFWYAICYTICNWQFKEIMTPRYILWKLPENTREPWMPLNSSECLPSLSSDAWTGTGTLFSASGSIPVNCLGCTAALVTESWDCGTSLIGNCCDRFRLTMDLLEELLSAMKGTHFILLVMINSSSNGQLRLRTAVIWKLRSTR